MNRKPLTAAVLALLFASAAHAAEQPCRTVRFEDGSTARIRESGSRCEYDFRLILKAGVKRKPVEIRSVTPDRCHVWVAEQALAKDKALIDKAWSQCIDASQAAEEAENAKR